MSRFHSNISIRIGLVWPSVRARVFIQKLSSQIFHLFASKDISQLTIVEQCRYLETVYDTDFTGEILSSPVTWKCMKKIILTGDKMLDLVQSRKRESLKHLSTLYSELLWLKIWDMALDYVIRGTKAALCLYGTLSRPLFGNRLCPRCVSSVTAGLTYIQHLCVCHPELELDTVDKLCDMIIASDPHIINIGQRLMKSLPLS